MHTNFLIARGYADTVNGKSCPFAVQVNFQRDVRTDPGKSDKQDGKFLIAPKDNRLRNGVASNKYVLKFVITILLNEIDKFFPCRLDDAAILQDMHDIRDYVLQKSLIVSDHD